MANAAAVIEGNTANDDSMEKLIREGMVSYPEAVVALQEFQRVVQERCEEVVSKRLSELSKAIGVKLDDKEISNYPTLGRHTHVGWDGKSVWLSVRLILKDVGTLYFGVGWDSDKIARREVTVATFVELSTKEAYDSALLKFKNIAGLEIKTKLKDHEIWLEETVPVKDAHMFQAHLNDLTTRFISAWQKIGGVKGLSSAG